MKAKIIELKPDERKAVFAITQDITAAKTAIHEASLMLANKEKELWEILRGLYPDAVGVSKSFDFENCEIRYFEPSTEVEKYRMLKEKAVKDQDWEKASEYRNLERKAREEFEKEIGKDPD